VKEPHKDRTGSAAWGRSALPPWIGYTVAAVIVGLAAAYLLYSRGWFDRWLAEKPQYPSYSISIGQHVFNVELALDFETRRKGMAFRNDVPADSGMLFVFPEARPAGEQSAFWMKNCLVDLDIAFLAPDRRIVTIYTMKARPLNTPDYKLREDEYWPTQVNLYAVEFRAGELARRGIKVGDRVEFSRDVEQEIKKVR
jgi:uncharacterized membrane protein (UPF0127 family)